MSVLRLFYEIIFWKSFVKVPFCNKEKITKNQLNKFKQVVYYAVNTVEFYKEYKDIINFNNLTFEAIKKLPLVDKTIIQKNQDEFLSKSYLKYFSIENSTSGSSGEPFKMIVTNKMFAIEKITYRRFWMFGKNYQYH
mgnify:CR=1 FL=1